MVGIIQPNGDEIADMADAGADAWIAAHRRQLFRLQLAQLVEALWRQHVARDVGNDFRQVAQLAVLVDHAGFFAARCAVTNESHDFLL
jgi:hypothetical protein